jgi:hypothetical protein
MKQGVLRLRTRERQPLLALYLLPTKNHPWTRTVPLDGCNLDVVPALDQRRALRSARDGIKRPAGCIDDYRIKNIGFATEDLELDGGTLIVLGTVDQSLAQRSVRG